MVPKLGVGVVGIFGGGEVVVYVTVWDVLKSDTWSMNGVEYFLGLREVFRIVMQCPDVHHDDRVLRNKVPLIPIIFSDIMIVSEFI